MTKIPGIRGLIQSASYKRMKEMVSGKDGTLYWYENRNNQRISAFYGSYEKYKSIGGWDDEMPNLNPQWKRLAHGYDESKELLDIHDLRGAAEFRGGNLVSPEWDGDMYSTLNWRCAFHHEFSGSPFLILRAGHWCPECLAPPWKYDEIAKSNPFFAQVWYTNHSEDENNFYPSDCYKDIL